MIEHNLSQVIIIKVTMLISLKSKRMIEHSYFSRVIIIKVTMLTSLKSKRMIEHSYFSRVIIIANKIGLGMT